MNVVLRLMEAAVEFVWWRRGGLHSYFHVQTNYIVEVVLRCVVVGVVTKREKIGQNSGPLMSLDCLNSNRLQRRDFTYFYIHQNLTYPPCKSMAQQHPTYLQFRLCLIFCVFLSEGSSNRDSRVKAYPPLPLSPSSTRSSNVGDYQIKG